MIMLSRLSWIGPWTNWDLEANGGFGSTFVSVQLRSLC